MEHVRTTVNDPRVKITTLEGFKGDPSFVSDTRSPGFATITRTVRQVFPETLAAPGLVLAATDSRHYAHLTHNIFRFNPVLLHQGDLSRIHGTDERISVEAYARAVEFYMRLIRNSCSGQELQGGA
jgi:carboxypeptidase PM20D1